MIRPLRSAPITGASPLLRAGPPACPATVLNLSQFLLPETLPLAASRTAADAGTGTCLPTLHAKAADHARVASMPDTAWPVNGLPPGLSRGPDVTPVSMSPDCITTRPQRFTRVRLPGPHLTPQPAPFPHRSPRSRHHSRSMWRFEASLRRATPKGQTFIFRTAPRTTAAYLHDHLPSRSRHTTRCNIDVSQRKARRQLRSESPGVAGDIPPPPLTCDYPITLRSRVVAPAATLPVFSCSRWWSRSLRRRSSCPRGASSSRR
jgi:hypothetical protein